MPRTHCPSHWLSWGHTLPQTAGKADDSAIILAASSKFPNLTCPMNLGIWILTGHLETHLGFLQFKHLDASSIASSLVYPKQTSLKFVALTLGACSVIGTLFILGILLFTSAMSTSTMMGVSFSQL